MARIEIDEILIESINLIDVQNYQLLCSSSLKFRNQDYFYTKMISKWSDFLFLFFSPPQKLTIMFSSV